VCARVHPYILYVYVSIYHIDKLTSMLEGTSCCKSASWLMLLSNTQEWSCLSSVTRCSYVLCTTHTLPFTSTVML